MSRVSEALERASAEGSLLIAKPLERSRQNPERSVEEKNTKNEDSSAGENGHVALNGLPRPKTNPALSFGNRIQGLIFGAGLRKIRELPLVFQDESSLAGEQYRILREQIRKTCGDESSRLLAITSPIKGDGKSTTAVNLAAVIALEHEQQVLLIDADLRSPSIHRFLSINATPGLTDYLSPSCKTHIAHYIHNTPLPGLRVLPAGGQTHASAAPTRS